MEHNPEMQEWMRSLEKSNRQQVRYARLQCLFAVLAAACCGAMLLAVLSVIPQIQLIAGQMQSLGTQAETVLTNLETVTNGLAQADLSGMVVSVDALVTDTQDGIKQALEKINALDIESLNQAIYDLSALIKPLADFVGKFK